MRVRVQGRRGAGRRVGMARPPKGSRDWRCQRARGREERGAACSPGGEKGTTGGGVGAKK